MPATSVELDDEILSLLGKLPQALRAAEKEVAKLEKQIADAARKGEQVSPEKLQRAAELRARAAGYREAVDTERRLKALEKQAKALEPGSSSIGEPPSSEPRKTTKREPLSQSTWEWLRGAGGRQRRGGLDMDEEAFRGIRGMLNTHNPHGTIRNIIHGNFGINNVSSMLARFGLASAAAAAPIVAATALFAVAKADAAKQAENAKITLSDQDERMQIARTFRHGGASANVIDFLRGLKYSGAEKRIEAENKGEGNPIAKLFALFESGPSQSEVMKSYQQKIALFNARTGSNFSTDPRKFVDDPNVRFKMHGQGFFVPSTKNVTEFGQGVVSNLAISAEKLAHSWWRGMPLLGPGWWTKSHVREETDLSMKQGETYVKSEQYKRENGRREYYEADPNRTVVMVDVEHQNAAIRQWQLERFTDWNSY